MFLNQTDSEIDSKWDFSKSVTYPCTPPKGAHQVNFSAEWRGLAKALLLRGLPESLLRRLAKALLRGSPEGVITDSSEGVTEISPEGVS